MAEEIREYMAQLGFRKFDDMIGQVQHLEMNPEVLHYKSQVHFKKVYCLMFVCVHICGERLARVVVAFDVTLGLSPAHLSLHPPHTKPKPINPPNPKRAWT